MFISGMNSIGLKDLDGKYVTQSILLMIIEVHQKFSLKRSFSRIVKKHILGKRDMCFYKDKFGHTKNPYQQNYDQVMQEFCSGESKYLGKNQGIMML